MVSLASDSEWSHFSSSLSTAVVIIKRRPDYNDVCPSCLLMTKPLEVWCCLQQAPAAVSSVVSQETDISLSLPWESRPGDSELCEHQLTPFPPSGDGGRAKAREETCRSER